MSPGKSGKNGLRTEGSAWQRGAQGPDWRSGMETAGQQVALLSEDRSTIVSKGCKVCLPWPTVT